MANLNTPTMTPALQQAAKEKSFQDFWNEAEKEAAKIGNFLFPDKGTVESSFLAGATSPQAREYWLEQNKGEWQLCPKCNGQGRVAKPPYLPVEINEWSGTEMDYECGVCNGAKIIAPPGSTTTASKEGKYRQALELIVKGQSSTGAMRLAQEALKD